jgi:5-methylcytosine-specific restriction endonuclease McrA
MKKYSVREKEFRLESLRGFYALFKSLVLKKVMIRSNKLDRRHYLRLRKALEYFNLKEVDQNKLNKLRAKAGFKKRVKKKSYKEKYYKYLQSEEWQEIRIEMLTAFPKCQRCDSPYSLQVHHKHYRNVFKEEPEDLEVLCKSCHKVEHDLK